MKKTIITFFMNRLEDLGEYTMGFSILIFIFSFIFFRSDNSFFDYNILILVLFLMGLFVYFLAKIIRKYLVKKGVIDY
ncbi:hypothetical protein Xbed_02307 [Xenorhabdus beddingii]|uniref:Uncharacterized protein n=1 Tax=Xenorhabdus beddingii TaxID=40578 RepID=A0A1Y2SLN4_9GAMM|nr:hypothetical protein [Xenorhabdus beddingii]OTA19453.1 hypothetical protein Xbed_02307 [Xenorhabdus beddingii]